jgi:hypothetical protein
MALVIAKRKLLFNHYVLGKEEIDPVTKEKMRRHTVKQSHTLERDPSPQNCPDWVLETNAFKRCLLSGEVAVYQQVKMKPLPVVAEDEDDAEAEQEVDVKPTGKAKDDAVKKAASK